MNMESLESAVRLGCILCKFWLWIWLENDKRHGSCTHVESANLIGRFEGDIGDLGYDL